MSSMHKPDAVPPSVQQIMDAIAGREASADELREMIAAALGNAWRDGAEAMRAEASAAAADGWNTRGSEQYRAATRIADMISRLDLPAMQRGT